MRPTLLLALLCLAALPSCRTTAGNVGAFGAGMANPYPAPYRYVAPQPAYIPPTPRNTSCTPNTLTGGFNCFSY